MKTKIFITVDTEFSIAGTFDDPIKNKPVGLPMVMCEKNGESHGLGFILDTLNSHGLNATFFVEAMNVNYFGNELMGQVARTIVERGSDVQLHLHPCWTYFKNPSWQQQLTVNPPNDDIRRRTQQEIESLIVEGIDIFSRWGIAPPCALRTGSLWVNRSVYKAMNNTGIHYSSNIGAGIYKPAEAEFERYSGYYEIEGCVELPILSYRDLGKISSGHLKALTVTGSGWREMEHLLTAAAQQQLDYLVILTHPFEFIKNPDNQFSRFEANSVNKKRFSKLCRFLQNNKEKFSVHTFAELPALPIKAKPSENTLLGVPLPLTVMRSAENYLNDRLAWL